jgi:4-hydroxy-tetrahydrodipicolinate synthase
VGIPILIYNIPGRSVVDMSVETMKRLFELKNIAGVKDATANMARVSAASGHGRRSSTSSRARMRRRWLQRPWRHGCISVPPTSRRASAPISRRPRSRAISRPRWPLQDRLLPLHTAIFLETNPSPIKYALSLIRPVTADVRLPMVPCSEPVKKACRRRCATPAS